MVVSGDSAISLRAGHLPGITGVEVQLKRGFSIVRRADSEQFVTAAGELLREQLIDICFSPIA